MHKDDDKEGGRDEAFRQIYRSCGLLFEQVEQSELPLIVKGYLLRQVAELYSAVEVFARLDSTEVHDG
jgi:hypothetical protein